MEITEFRVRLEDGWWVLRLYSGRKRVGKPEAYRERRTALGLASYVAEKFEDESAPDLAYYDPEHGGSKA
jgi:hypothetical protein